MTLACEFQKMLIVHGLEKKVCWLPAMSILVFYVSHHQILAFNGNNATLNDKQATCLHDLPNSFNEVNWVRCFNHMMQLSTWSLLKPFSTSVNDNVNNSDDNDNDNTPVEIEGFDGNNKDDSKDDNKKNKEEAEDALESLSAEEREALLENTTEARTTLDKVHCYYFFYLTY